MIFPGFPGVLSFFQVFQVEWEPCHYEYFFNARRSHYKAQYVTDLQVSVQARYSDSEILHPRQFVRKHVAFSKIMR